jgi:mono/diheme cytochrome c family protein
MKNARLLWIPIVLLVIVLAGWWWRAHTTTESSTLIAGQDASALLKDPAVIAKGRYLATVGDCMSCHTEQGGEPYAGGRVIPTPFGNIPAPNITPDPEHGLGRWSFDDFWRAMHTGIGRDGERLYPVFSYTSFTKTTPEDAIAIFAYLQSLTPVAQASKTPSLHFPYNVRSTLAAWRALYFKPGVYKPNPAQSAEWNRGAYLVQGLGHCNECHAQRDAWGGLQGNVLLSGGRIPVQDWYAPDLSTQANGGIEGWTQQNIVDLLKTGQSSKGTAFGPMADVVVNSTQYLHDDDLRAIATYLQSLPARPKLVAVAPSFDSGSLVDRGHDIYAKRCVDCHGENGAGVPGVYPPLDGNSSVAEPTGINAARAVLLGGFAPLTQDNPRPYSMPPYAQQLSDADVAAVVTYIRQAWSNRASAVEERGVAAYRHTPID